MKKKFFALLSVIVLAIAVPTTAYACGKHRGSWPSVKTSYYTCNIQNCNIVTQHTHNKINYYGHYYGDGHSYHNLCNVSDCYLTYSHKHNNITCLPHNSNDGHYYHEGHH